MRERVIYGVVHRIEVLTTYSHASSSIIHIHLRSATTSASAAAASVIIFVIVTATWDMMRVGTGGSDLSASEGGNEVCERWAEGVHRLVRVVVKSPRRAPKMIDVQIMSSVSHPESVTLRSVAISGGGQP